MVSTRDWTNFASVFGAENSTFVFRLKTHDTTSSSFVFSSRPIINEKLNIYSKRAKSAPVNRKWAILCQPTSILLYIGYFSNKCSSKPIKPQNKTVKKANTQ